MSETFAGDIIDIEVSTDSGTTWNVVAKTRGTVSLSPNVGTAESGTHSSIQQEKAAVSEAWEMSFEKLAQSTLAGLTSLGLHDGANMVGFNDVDSGSNTSLRISVYEDEAAKTGGTAKATIEMSDYILILEDYSLEEDDFAAVSFNTHIRERPALTGAA